MRELSTSEMELVGGGWLDHRPDDWVDFGEETENQLPDDTVVQDRFGEFMTPDGVAEGTGNHVYRGIDSDDDGIADKLEGATVYKSDGTTFNMGDGGNGIPMIA